MIFISYRISDSKETTDRLDADLAKVFGRAKVFRDKKRLKDGEKWPIELEKNATDCDVMLVVIGLKWQTAAYTDAARLGTLRLHDENDWVRKEITIALGAGKTVIPILIDGQKMPSTEWLAKCGLEALAHCQARELRIDDYKDDLAKLTARLKELCPIPKRVTTGGSNKQPAPVPPPPEPSRRPENLPYSTLGSLFKGRDDFIEKLRETLLAKPGHAAAVVAKKHAIHGLGGVGKTRLAVEYALKFREEYKALLFVTADSPSNLQRNLAALCGALVLNLPEQDVKEEEKQAAAALRWLHAHPGWFLILDNVDTEDAAKEVEKMIAGLTAGHIVVTSRLADWSSGVEALELDVLDETSAAEFLLERTKDRRKRTATDDADARALSKDVDGLALALEQAGAFVAKHRESFADYRTRWAAQDEKVREWFDERLSKYPKSVAQTWQTSFDQLHDDGRQLLNVLAWLAPDPMPADMVLQKHEFKKLEFDTEAGLAELTTYSLAKRPDDGSKVIVHRLVQDVTRKRIPEEERKPWVEQALRMVYSFSPAESGDVRTWSVWDPLRPHVQSVIRHAEKHEITDPTTRLMNVLGMYYLAKAAYDESEPLNRRALAIEERKLGTDHPNVAIYLSNLAQLLQATNRLAEAEPLMRRALAIDEQSYGKDNPAVASDLNNLARLLQDTNRLAGAEPLMRRALAIDEQSYGKDHPDVAIDLNNLATLLQDTNRLEEAEPLMRRALAIDEQNYGKDHPEVAIDLSNLATLLQATNRLAEAEPLMARVVTIFEKSLGENHPNVATALNNLATSLQVTKRLAEAEPLMRRALAIDEQSYGNDHPEVATDLNNLARLLQATNRWAEAEPLLCRALLIWHRFKLATGHTHPNWEMGQENYRLFLINGGLSEADAERRIQKLLDEATPPG